MFPTQPLSIGGVLDAGVNFFSATFKQTLKLSMIAAVPYALVSMMMSFMGGSLDPNIEDPDEAAAAVMEAFGTLMLFMPLLYLTMNFMAATVGHRLVALARGEETSDVEDCTVGLKLMLPLTVMMILYVVLMMLGMVLLIVPGIIVAVTMSLFVYVPLMEDRSAWTSLWRSHVLVWRGNWWRTLATLTIITVLIMVVAGCVALLLGGFSGLNAESEMATVFTLIEGVGTWLMMALLTPLSSSMFLVLYNDIGLRHDGDDLDSRLAQLDSDTLEA